MSVVESRRKIAEQVGWSTIGNHVEPALRGQLIDAIEAALKERDERAAKVLETRANELQTEWDAPPSAENGFIEMTADTPAGYATWYSMGQLRKLATTIREDTPVKRTNDEVQCADCGTFTMSVPQGERPPKYKDLIAANTALREQLAQAQQTLTQVRQESEQRRQRILQLERK